MKQNKNPELKKGDRIILINMPGESLFAGTKGIVEKIEKTPSFDGQEGYQYRIRWVDEDDNVISTLSLLPNEDSWLLDPEFNQNNLNEARITDIDVLIRKADWLKLFKRAALKIFLKFLD